MPQSQWIVLLIAATVAGVVLVRLYLVLGRRTGAEPLVPASAAHEALAAPTPASVVDPGVPGLAEIKLADKSFDAAKFLDGARAAYRLIVTAFEKGDREALRPLLSDDIFRAFGSVIDARAGAAKPYSFAAIKEARITAAAVENSTMEITVTFNASFDPPAADAVGAPHDVTDVWTFAKPAGATNPNWTLVATTGEPS